MYAMLVLVPTLVELVRSHWRHATAWREEVRRLVQMVTEVSELAERESMLVYYSNIGTRMTETMKGYGGRAI
jgi:ubiquitin carboxyl-terminal hydrolase 36/42